MAVSWLDAARYADSYGYQSDRLSPTWPWRDWVVQAFNDNLPYDRFITWQLAGDLLPEPPEPAPGDRVQPAASHDQRGGQRRGGVARRVCGRPRPHLRNRVNLPLPNTALACATIEPRVARYTTAAGGAWPMKSSRIPYLLLIAILFTTPFPVHAQEDGGKKNGILCNL